MGDGGRAQYMAALPHPTHAPLSLPESALLPFGPGATAAVAGNEDLAGSEGASEEERADSERRETHQTRHHTQAPAQARMSRRDAECLHHKQLPCPVNCPVSWSLLSCSNGVHIYSEPVRCSLRRSKGWEPSLGVGFQYRRRYQDRLLTA